MNLKKTVSLLLGGALALSLAVPAMAAQPWYAEAQTYVTEKGLMVGTGSGFEPEATVTYYSVIQTLYNMDGRPNATEAPDPWYADALSWWKDLTGMTITGNDIEPVRGNVKDLLATYCGAKKLDGSGLMVGNEKGDMMQEKTLTRAEFAQILMRLDQLVPAEEALTVTGKVTEVEKYGHGLLDITIADFKAMGFELGDIVTVTAGTYTGDMPFFDGYYVDAGGYMLRAYPSHTNIGVCINYGKFCEEAGIGVGDEVTITLKEKAGALATQTVYSLVYTNERADYESDEIFANFRPVVMGDIAEGMLYRSASPINNENNRAAIADDLIEAAGVKTVMNLADTAEEIGEYTAAEDFDSPYYKGLYDEGGVIVLGMPVNYASDEFAQGIVQGLTFLSEHEGPYLVHCTEGKDRAGFTAALLEALMGAKLDEVVADYMTSYVNYYHLDPETEQDKYDLIAESNVKEMLRSVAGLEKGADLTGVDLAQAAENYLTSHGMTAEAVAALKANLKG